MGLHRRLVYVLKNQDKPSRYCGLTSTVMERLTAHNAGHWSHTARRGSWEIDVVIEFADEERAVRFERYPTSASFAAVLGQKHSSLCRLMPLRAGRADKEYP